MSGSREHSLVYIHADALIGDYAQESARLAVLCRGSSKDWTDSPSKMKIAEYSQP